ncbi:hypothetical protein FP263_17215 [Salmonella enterica subsp. enterica]|nr:hypothetical protein [Salmonella enterica subsp. enterica serovar Newport]
MNISLYKITGLFFILMSFSFDSFPSDVGFVFDIKAKVIFDVDNDGNVVNVNILKVTPRFIFDDFVSLIKKNLSESHYQKGNPLKNQTLIFRRYGIGKEFKINNCTPFAPYFIQPFKYPLKAQELGLKGKVTFSYDINSVGLVDNVHILSAQPSNLFEKAVKDSVFMWRYDCFGSEVKGIVVTVFFGHPSHVEL